MNSIVPPTWLVIAIQKWLLLTIVSPPKNLVASIVLFLSLYLTHTLLLIIKWTFPCYNSFFRFTPQVNCKKTRVSEKCSLESWWLWCRIIRVKKIVGEWAIRSLYSHSCDGISFFFCNYLMECCIILKKWKPQIQIQ